RAFSSGVRFFLAICNTSDVVLLFYTTSEVYTKFGMVSPISYFRFYFPEYVLKTRLPPNCATGFLDSLRAGPSFRRPGSQALRLFDAPGRGYLL
ncbi:hypothetical protein, partial [Dysosmobacter sp. HCP28S3_G4]|uniref:hypothetical protein n=1 Tax=Dysosmobacter sp. HCP28S3_G4 TaxID=3438938 RepID=UPI003F8B3B86